MALSLGLTGETLGDPRCGHLGIVDVTRVPIDHLARDGRSFRESRSIFQSVTRPRHERDGRPSVARSPIGDEAMRSRRWPNAHGPRE
jgi:hypothetical protein